MALLAEWKSSLEMFRPKNLKLLSLVVLNAFKQAYKAVIFNIGWWLLAFVVMQCIIGSFFLLEMELLRFLLGSLVSARPPLGKVWVEAFIYLGQLSLLFLWCITIRPSVERKSGRYFLSFIKQFLYLLPFYYFCFALGYWIFPIERFFILAPHFSIYGGLLFAAPAIFFALDSNGSFRRVIRAYWQGIKMLVYGAPVYLAIILFYRLLAWGLWQISIAATSNYAQQKLLENASFHLLSWFIVPFFVCIMSVIYTKKVHDNSELYR